MHLAGFHPAVRAWFLKNLSKPTDPQKRAWPAIRRGEHTLVAAPTGSGKTLAAFLAVLDRLLTAETPQQGTRVVYVSPLKALSNDIHKNLELPLQGIAAELGVSTPPIRAAVRTGDTPAKERLAHGKNPPDILVTTPESLYILLTSESGRRMLGGVDTVIVDEIHALVGNKRGSHLALSLERLAALSSRPLQRIGLSATQTPIELVARFLVGTAASNEAQPPPCTIIDEGHRRQLDLRIEVPAAPLSAVMSNEVWGEVYDRLSALIAEHRTTLVFVNTRRLAERVARELGERLGEEAVTSHHGSLSAKLRLSAEARLKAGQLKALVATASLELGIDIGSVDLVCQLGTTRSLANLLQRVGRAGHNLAAIPKGRVFPLTRDELAEAAALVRAVLAGELDAVCIPEGPLDILAQQLVAEVASRPRLEAELLALVRKAYPYRNLSSEHFAQVVSMLAQGYSSRRGRRGSYLVREPHTGELRARRGARLVALTSGGAIGDTADYQVVLEPAGTVIGSLNEDFAVESVAGDIFQLGNSSWEILRVEAGRVRVADAHGQPPNLPFWLGEAPGRTVELSSAVSTLRRRLDGVLPNIEGATALLARDYFLDEAAARQLAEYYAAAQAALGCLPTDTCVVAERFFDESGGMQLVLHAPFGSRINRALGLALRKSFCRSFNFELQAAAGEDAIVLSLGMQHSFPLADVFRFVHSRTARDVLVQALLTAPMFQIRWRHNAGRSLALPRSRGGKRVPPPLLRMQAEDFLAAVFPEQLACQENMVGDRPIPDHPLVRQTIDDCLTEAMDIEGLLRLVGALESGAIKAVARDLPEPSPLCHEILNARPYAFLDDAPLEERRTQAVYMPRTHPEDARELGALDKEAIRTVRAEVWPQPRDADEMYDALLQLGWVGREELAAQESWLPLIERLEESGRAVASELPAGYVAYERAAELATLYAGLSPSTPPDTHDREAAIRELVRGRLECSGPTTSGAVAQTLQQNPGDVEVALLQLEAEGFVLRGSFTPDTAERQWCERRLLARIHRLTIGRLRAEIEPVTTADFLRYLLRWQRLTADTQARGPEGLSAVIEQLDGWSAAAVAWEAHLLPSRIVDYDPHALDGLCLSGRLRWARLARGSDTGGASQSLRQAPVALVSPELLDICLMRTDAKGPGISARAERVAAHLAKHGASFFAELQRQVGLVPSELEDVLAELCVGGIATADSFAGLRALLHPARKRTSRTHARPRLSGLATAGRWALLGRGEAETQHDDGANMWAQRLLRRYGVVFRSLCTREALAPPWRELARQLRRMEARGEIRGGRFVAAASGEQFALPEALGLLRNVRRQVAPGELTVIAAADPANLAGVLTPGKRVAAFANNRLLLKDGLPVATSESGVVTVLAGEITQQFAERLLRPHQRARTMDSASLRV